jgi:hypothetical protein
VEMVEMAEMAEMVALGVREACSGASARS